MKIRAILLASILVLTGTAAAAAQTDLPIAFGDRVRVVSPEVRGAFWFKEMRGDTLVLQGHQLGSELHVPVASLERLDRDWGRDHARGMRVGLMVGAGIGAASGAAFGLASGDGPIVSAQQGAVLAAIAGGFYGAIAGALVGLARPPYHWVPVHLPARTAAVPTGNRGVGVSISLDF